jgi:hypothetical protein
VEVAEVVPVGGAQIEVAATGTAGESGRRFASEEFFFLLQRIDRLDEKLTARTDSLEQKLTARIDGVEQKLTARIDGVEQKLTARIDGVEHKLDSLRAWAIGLLLTLLAGFAGVIVALLRA